MKKIEITTGGLTPYYKTQLGKPLSGSAVSEIGSYVFLEVENELTEIYIGKKQEKCRKILSMKDKQGQSNPKFKREEGDYFIEDNPLIIEKE